MCLVLPPDRIKQIQQIVGTVMYYTQAVNITTLFALSSITAKKAQSLNKLKNLSTPSWTTLQPTKTPQYDMLLLTWSSTSTQMHHIYPNHEHKATLEEYAS
jgi:hypothetical protein